MESQPKLEQTSWLEKPLSEVLPRWNLENILAIVILLVALISRFAMLDARVMSHDEVNHVVPSWDLFQGSGYRHDPVTHGPMQFHLVALSYFMLGDNDFSARVPAALFSTAAVAVVLFGFRRYLGRSGSLLAGLLFTISPYLLFYGRYVRNEGFIELFGVLLLLAMLRYLEKGDKFSLFLVAIITSLHFATKETAFIYTAQYLLFVGVMFLENTVRVPWENTGTKNRFALLMIIMLALLGIALGLAVWNAQNSAVPGAESAANLPAQASPTAGEAPGIRWTPQLYGEVVAVLAALVIGVLAVVLLVRNLGWQNIRKMRSFDLLILVGTLILPQLTAFPVKMAGFDPLDYSTSGMIVTGVFLAVMTAVSIAIGLWWNGKLWLKCAAVFYTIFTVLYTTFFTNPQGFFTGIIGSLGYWLSQQGVNRGSQPWYYYGLIQVPMYEYLALLGLLVGVFFAVRHARFSSYAGQVSPASAPSESEENPEARIPVFSLLVYWSLTALIAYSLAGEKMPWLTVHIALPLALAGGWGLGYLVDTTQWKKIANLRGLLVGLLIPVFLTALTSALGSVLGDQPPFRGSTLDQLQATNRFLLSLMMTGFSAGVLTWLLRGWSFKEALRLVSVFAFGLLTVLTIRTAYYASFIRYDYAEEFLVYAHAAPGPKEVLKQVEEISRRTTGGLDLKVAYDNDGLYPYWWYLRDYPNKFFFGDKPSRSLQEYPVIIAADTLTGKMEPIVREDYYKYDTTRLWWPMQDYFDLSLARIWNAITDPNMRAAIFDIWFDRDYSKYAELTGSTTLRPETWQPASRMRVYIRKDVAAQVWNYGTVPAAAPLAEAEPDPFEQKQLNLNPDVVVGTAGPGQGQFQSPRGVAAAPDGTVFVADSNNHRIQHFTADGVFLNAWGTFADAAKGDAPGGTFNEPWGLTVGKDGSVYVADTWNHRIQKFTADGQFLKMWGYFGQAEAPDAFWGPRSVVVDDQNRVYVTDTGNKRIAVFSSEGEFITQFGTTGVEPGQFDEPVGLAIDSQGNLYVADTWNQRVQIFSPDSNGNYAFTKQWKVYGWFGQSLDNKPYLAVGDQGQVYITDPESYRIMEYSNDGEALRSWNGLGQSQDNFSMPVGITVDNQGRIWTVDSGNNYLIRFPKP